MTKQPKSTTNTKHNGVIAGYDAYLWRTVDSQRGIDAAEYTSLCLGPLFLNHIERKTPHGDTHLIYCGPTDLAVVTPRSWST